MSCTFEHKVGCGLANKIGFSELLGYGVAKFWVCNVAKCLWCSEVKRERLPTSWIARLPNVNPVPGSRFKVRFSAKKPWGFCRDTAIRRIGVFFLMMAHFK